MPHTKGPWKVVEQDAGVHAPESDTRIMDATHHGCGPQWEEQLANSYLIAAAPDMLEALEATLPFLGATPVQLKKAKAAIAKARGKE